MADNAFNRPRNALMDTAQGVSKGFWADGLGGPVDLITTLANLGIAGGGYAGHKLGLLSQPPELIQNPTGGSEWIAQQMRQRGLLNDNPGSTADNYGRVAGGLLAPLTQARAPQIANALNQAPAALQRGAYAVGEKAAGMAENHLVRQGAIQPATVWHGTPHKFDKFDASKIGTGEGAQAYGHGLYLAEAPEVARSYQRQLGGFDIAFGGKPKRKDSEELARRFIAAADGDVKTAAERLSSNRVDDKATIKDALRIMNGATSQERGQLYKVDLPDEQIAKMLDWDRPLKDQPGLIDVVRQVRPGYMQMSPGKTKASDAYFSLADEVGHAKAAEMFKSAGFPGVRYLDGGSRDGKAGTSNFVVFPGNEGVLSILERNGQPLR